MNTSNTSVSLAGNGVVVSSAGALPINGNVGNAAAVSAAGSGPSPQPAKFHESCRNLYVGNLDPRVTEYTLQELFASLGQVVMVKIIPDKTHPYGRGNYGFVEFNSHQAAEQAMQMFNGRKVFDSEVRISWALTPSNLQKEDTTNHFQIFIGDLSAEVTDQILAKSFSTFGSLSEARVMWDPTTGKSRGYGFVSFRQKGDADQAINAMNGQWLGSRTIRCNWANQKPNAAMQVHHPQQAYDEVVMQAPMHNSTVYVGNLPFFTTREHLISHFQQFGGIHEIRMQAERGFAFVRMETHEGAAMAITKLQGANINGRPARCAWGKDRAVDMISMYGPGPGMPPTPIAVTAAALSPHAGPGAAFAYGPPPPPPGGYPHPMFQSPGFSGPMTPDLSNPNGNPGLGGPQVTMQPMDPVIAAAAAAAGLAPGGFASYDAYAAASYYGGYGAPPGGMPYLPSGVGTISFATGPPDAAKAQMAGQRIPH
ncbi:hypothetical protein BDF19DRAFT_410055 [Syncephalis fuscata]|nr:hypothetical protein BDF19DRAFT_410055 [Syncephalis fuscata]